MDIPQTQTKRFDGRLSSLLETVVTAASDAVLITEAGSVDEAEGGPRIVYANDAFARMTGYSAAEVVGRTPRLLQCDDTDGGTLRRIRAALQAWEPVEVELLNRRKDGRQFWVEVSIAPAVDDAGTCTHWVSIQRDITQRREREANERESLRLAQERLRGAFGHAPIGMAVASPTGVLLEVNPALAGLIGRSPGSLLGRTLFDITHPDDRDAALQACRRLREDGGSCHQECRFEHAGGRQMDVIVHSSLVADGDGEPDHVIIHVQDVSERNVLERELLRRALSDDLTQLPNRPMLLDRLDQAVARRNRDGSGLAVLFLDVDGFKDVNDRLGHAAGDALLVALAKRLQQSIRPGDTVARFGGDEFVVMCERISADEARNIAGRVGTAATERFEFGQERLVPSASIGLAIATGPEHAVPEILLRDADAAMYEAKRSGPGRLAVFDTAMRARDSHRREEEAELRGAIARGELTLHYQPQLDLATDAVVAMEALVRWDHPERGILPPREFIPVAERAGLIDALGGWVAETACAEAVRAPIDGVVWINLSAQQLRPGLAANVAQILARTGLPADRLGLELTESVLMRDLSLAHDQLAALRRLGVRLAIDDFGTGYSSLAYLAELPVDTVKVDRSFTARLTSGPQGGTVIKAVLGMAAALGLEVVVEGVETAAQLTVLRELGFQRVQGYLLGAPTQLVFGGG